MAHEWEVGIENQLQGLYTRVEALEQRGYGAAQKDNIEAEPSTSTNTESVAIALLECWVDAANDPQTMKQRFVDLSNESMQLIAQRAHIS